jgi:hypothetical protein
MRTPRVPAPPRHDPTHGSPHPVNYFANHCANHCATQSATATQSANLCATQSATATQSANLCATHSAHPAVTLARRMVMRLATPTLGLALLAVTPLSAGPIACASGTGTPPPAHRNNAERPPPFALAPDFSVPDATGTPRDLASLMGPKGLVLVLYRGHW